MKFISIFNDVLGPVMRGPSSSHTAGSYRIARIARSLLGDTPVKAVFTFDPQGSYCKTYTQQGVDLGFAAGLMEWDITDSRFREALDYAGKSGIEIDFAVQPIENADHPNTVIICLTSASGKELFAIAKSTGGGGIQFTRMDKWDVNIDGKANLLFIEIEKNAENDICGKISSDLQLPQPESKIEAGERLLLTYSSDDPFSQNVTEKIDNYPGNVNSWLVQPVFFPKKGEDIFDDASTIIQISGSKNISLGQTALKYECTLLGLSEEDSLREMIYRYKVMKESVYEGLNDENVKMQLLGPTAKNIFDSADSGRSYIGGLHTKAAAMAMASMHISNSMGIVCAAPTGGSAGVIPGLMTALEEEKNLSPEDCTMALFAAGAVGLIIAKRATFAAEVAGCQVEIGAAGAMAAAAVVELAGGTAEQALDAAAISLQNTMGSVCDLVQGMCEIPCHTRNAIAASSAFVSADLILGGYRNPIGLDETVDASFASGKMLPPELRCTALGGLAVTPSAESMKKLR
ncbi:MAG: hypothetical protein GY863_15045 [bacterium]|nr:hypothetical protein [bacterium]